MKFVDTRQPKQYAEDLHNTQVRIAELRQELAVLKKKEDELTQFLYRLVNRSFQYNGKRYLKQLRFYRSRKMIVDIEACRKLLKNKTPYKEAVGPLRAKVDFVYERK